MLNSYGSHSAVGLFLAKRRGISQLSEVGASADIVGQPAEHGGAAHGCSTHPGKSGLLCRSPLVGGAWDDRGVTSRFSSGFPLADDRARCGSLKRSLLEGGGAK